ncbi:hypothetical protein D9M68_803060 [compost metagenome]
MNEAGAGEARQQARYRLEGQADMADNLPLGQWHGGGRGQAAAPMKAHRRVRAYQSGGEG